MRSILHLLIFLVLNDRPTLLSGCDFLVKKSIGSRLSWWTVDGQGSVFHTSAPTNNFFDLLNVLYK